MGEDDEEPDDVRALRVAGKQGALAAGDPLAPRSDPGEAHRGARPSSSSPHGDPD